MPAGMLRRIVGSAPLSYDERYEAWEGRTMKLLAKTAFCAIALASCSMKGEGEKPAAASAGADFIYVWAGDMDGRESDFLAVIDANADAPTYGDVVATLPVGAVGTMPHHVSYEYPENDILFANGWLSGQTFVFDLKDPVAPKLKTSFAEMLGYSYPHSYAPLDNGNVLATFQGTNGNYGAPGGLVEITSDGEPVRAASAIAPSIEAEAAWPYSLAFIPGKSLAVVAISEMGMPPWTDFYPTDTVEIWDTDKLDIRAVVQLPDTGAGYGNLYPAEPRIADDGRVFVTTFSCGVYEIIGAETDAPSAQFIHVFPGSNDPNEACAVPVIVGKFLVAPISKINGLIVLDISDAGAAKEVSRLSFDEAHPGAHWIAADRNSDRLVVTGNMQSWVMVLNLDPETGALSIDEKFGGAAGPGVSFDRAAWPHGETGRAEVHGALFRR